MKKIGTYFLSYAEWYMYVISATAVAEAGGSGLWPDFVSDSLSENKVKAKTNG